MWSSFVSGECTATFALTFAVGLVVIIIGFDDVVCILSFAFLRKEE